VIDRFYKLPLNDFSRLVDKAEITKVVRHVVFRFQNQWLEQVKYTTFATIITFD